VSGRAFLARGSRSRVTLTGTPPLIHPQGARKSIEEEEEQEEKERGKRGDKNNKKKKRGE
jgi:hypothetical protein